MKRAPDPKGQPGVDALPVRRFAEPAKTSLKALLAAAPLDGIEIERSRDGGRDIEL
jgi:hypothetical protein